MLSVLRHRLPDATASNPGDVVLHDPGYVECRVCHCIDAHLHVALLYVLNRVLDSLRHLHPLHDDRQPPSTEGTHFSPLLNGSQTLPRVDEPHLVQFVRDLVSLGDAVLICGFQHFHLRYELGQLPNELIVFLVVVSILHMVPPQHSVLFRRVIFLPIQEIHLLKQLFLMELQFAHRHNN